MDFPRVAARPPHPAAHAAPRHDRKAHWSQDHRPVPIGMVNPYFEVHMVPARRFLHVRMKGVWDQDIFNGFARDYAEAIDKMHRMGGIDYALIDGSEFGTQSAEITDRFPALIRETDPKVGHRTAVVYSAIVNKVQAREAGELLNARYFRTAEAASEWLFGSEA